MEPQNNFNEGQVQSQKSPLHQVTPLSKYLAMVLFVVLPFVGAWVGYTLAPAESKESLTKLQDRNESSALVDETEASTTDYSVVSSSSTVERSSHLISYYDIVPRLEEKIESCPGTNTITKDVKVGDKVGPMTVTNITQYEEDYPLGPDNMIITLTGSMEIIGIPTWEEIGDAGLTLDEASAKALPCIDNQYLPSYEKQVRVISLDVGAFDPYDQNKISPYDPYKVTISQLRFYVRRSAHDSNVVTQGTYIEIEDANLLTTF